MVSENSITRRQAISAGAVALAGLAVVGNTVEAQEQKPNTKQVTVYVTDKELEDWTRDIVAAFTAGLPLIKIFEDAGAKTQNEHLQRFSKDAPDMLEKGYILSDLMEMNRHIFTRDYVTTVRYGEIYGVVDTALKLWLTDRPKRD